ncbi:MAG: hypothetical protein M3Q08_03635 [Pseudomonadota bacterium]|nr:hypothetical protein [Pseudomonadota bacterium]
MTRRRLSGLALLAAIALGGAADAGVSASARLMEGEGFRHEGRKMRGWSWSR